MRWVARAARVRYEKIAQVTLHDAMRHVVLANKSDGGDVQEELRDLGSFPDFEPDCSQASQIVNLKTRIWPHTT